MNIQVKKIYYGDIPEDNAGGSELKNVEVSPSDRKSTRLNSSHG